MQQVGAVFPLKWMAQGLRSVFLPDTAAPAGAGRHRWEHGRIALVLAAWCVGGLVLCLMTFRWHSDAATDEPGGRRVGSSRPGSLGTACCRGESCWRPSCYVAGPATAPPSVARRRR